MREEMLHGRGFKLLRGLPIQDRPIEEVAFMYWGIGAHLGYAVSQNAKGHVLGHVKDLGLNYADPQARGYQTSARLPYHTDYSDLVGLLCLKKARSGGLSSIVSSSALYNHIMAERPDLGEALMQPFYRTRWGEVGSDRPAWIEVPAFNTFEGGRQHQLCEKRRTEGTADAGSPAGDDKAGRGDGLYRCLGRLA